MLFDVQMRWNEQGRSSPEELWDLNMQEIEHAQTTIADGMVRGATRSSRSHVSREDGWFEIRHHDSGAGAAAVSAKASEAGFPQRM